MTSAEAARPTLPNIALNALYVACLLWLTELRNVVADVMYMPSFPPVLSRCDPLSVFADRFPDKSFQFAKNTIAALKHLENGDT